MKLKNSLIALMPIFHAAFGAQTAHAGGHKISIGAAAAKGGSNPISFSDPSEFSYTYINSSKDREFIVGLLPGIGYAARFMPHKDVAISLGGILTAGPWTFAGLYSGFSWEFWCPTSGFCLNLDYRTSTALYSMKKKISGASSVSLGGTLWTN
jgi:hypothetical protein